MALKCRTVTCMHFFASTVRALLRVRVAHTGPAAAAAALNIIAGGGGGGGTPAKDIPLSTKADSPLPPDGKHGASLVVAVAGELWWWWWWWWW